MIKFALTALALCASSTSAFAQQAGGNADSFGGLDPERLAVAQAGTTPELAASAIETQPRSAEQQALFLQLARAGHLRAQERLGFECFFKDVCPVTITEAHKLLKPAAQTRMPAAISLARAYRDGKTDGTAYPLIAAQWFIHAGMLGWAGADNALSVMEEMVVRQAFDAYTPSSKDADLFATLKARVLPVEDAPTSQPLQPLNISPESRAVVQTQTPVPQVRNAISNFVRDGSDGETILKLARAGHRDAGRVLGHHCLRSGYCPPTRKEAHDLLVTAAQSEPASAVTLGAIYRDGFWGNEPYPVDAAKWFVHANTLGDESASYLLAQLHIDAVREAGGEALLPAPVSTPQATQTTQFSPRSTTRTGTTDPAAPIILQDGTSFSILVDSLLTPKADIAASCLLIMEPVIKARSANLEQLQAQYKNGDAISNVGTWGKMATAESGLSIILLSYETALRIVENKAMNGGYSGDALDREIARHELALQANPGSGPATDLCEDKMTSVLIEGMGQ